MFGSKKPKTKVVQMRMSPFDDPAIFEVNQDEEGLITGVMGGCCSVVLLSGTYTTGRGFNKISGQHGAGGPGALNWPELLKGFDTSINNKIVMSCAASDYENYIEKIKAAMTANGVRCRRDFHKYSDAIVWRDGSVQEYTFALSRSRNLEVRTWR